MSEQQSDIFDIVKQVGQLLSGLPQDQQERVLHSVSGLLGVKSTLPRASHPTSTATPSLSTHSDSPTPTPAHSSRVGPNRPTDIRTFVLDKQPRAICNTQQSSHTTADLKHPPNIAMRLLTPPHCKNLRDRRGGSALLKQPRHLIMRPPKATWTDRVAGSSRSAPSARISLL